MVETSHPTEKTGPAFQGSQVIKLLVEFGPLVVFFYCNSHYGIYGGTAAFMAATAISLVASRLLLGKIPVMPLVTGVFVFIFGGLTVWLQNDTFIKLKPTIVNLLFSAMLLGGLLLDKPLLRHLFGDAFKLDEAGWRKLTLRWGLFFVVLAVLNEFVWRNYSTDTWVTFKTFGIMPLSFVFAISQVGVIMRHQIQPKVVSNDVSGLSKT